MFGFRKRKESRRPAGWGLDVPLLLWGDGATFDVRAACAGTAILGATGAGKSTSSLRVMLLAMLRAGFGGILFTSKPEDTANYIQYVKEAGREGDLRVISIEDQVLRYNFIAEEQAHCRDPVILAENLTALLMTLSELGERQGSGGGGGGDNEQFFKLFSMRLSRTSLLVLILSGLPLTMANLHRLIVTAPQTPEQARSETFQKGSFLYQCLKAGDPVAKSPSLQADYEMAVTFFMEEWPGLSSRTRSIVQAMLTATTDQLSRGAARDLLSSPSPNVSPADTYDGAVFVVDAPVLRWREVGRLIQVTLKYCWQWAHARRDIKQNDRPTFMIADEAQLLLVDADNEFQAISRSTRTAVVYATQSVSGMLEAMGGTNAEPKVMSLLSNLQTKVVHQSTDSRTVRWFQEMIGKSTRLTMNANQSQKANWLAPLFGEDEGSVGFSEHMDFELEAADFNRLATGGPPHWRAEALIYQGGRTFPNGRTWMRTAIPQKG
ncbi:MAG: type IV secretory system conjugative DNA transfer family protein [Dehalococcoidia bacterium]